MDPASLCSIWWDHFLHFQSNEAKEDDSREFQPDRSVDREFLIQDLKQKHVYHHSEHFAQVTLWVLALSKAD